MRTENLTPERIAELRRLIHVQHDYVGIHRETLAALLDAAERDRLRMEEVGEKIRKSSLGGTVPYDGVGK